MRHAMRGRNCFGQPVPDRDQVSVADLREQLEFADRYANSFGPYWTTEFQGSGSGYMAVTNAMWVPWINNGTLKIITGLTS